MVSSTRLMSIEDAQLTILQQVIPISAIESINLSDAAGRITATDIHALTDVPPFASSAMDGYAVRLADLKHGISLPVGGKIYAGQTLEHPWPVGTCLRIMTGAPVPPDADAVVMQEQTETHVNGISFPDSVIKGQNIRQAGEDMLRGSTILSSGCKLGAAQLPLLASQGIETIHVRRRLKVAIFSTGDELQSPGTTLAPGQIYDTNRFALRLMLEKYGCELLDLGIIRDDPAALRQAFDTANHYADLVITSGGVSVGEADYIKALLDEMGEITFWKLAIKPGKPFAFGRLSDSWFCGLPGNPVSATVTFCQLVLPLLCKLSGQPPYQPLRLRARTISLLKKQPGRTDFQRGYFTTTASGELQVSTTGHQGSHIFSSFSQANCFIVLERERGNVAPGEWVEIELFSALLRE